MAARIQHKRSSVAGNVPDPSALDVGALAINFADRYIYTKTGASAVIRLTGHIPLALPTNVTVGDSYIDVATGKQYAYFSLNGDPDAWHELAPPEDLSPFIKKDGSVAMTGQLTLVGSASGNEAVSYTQTSSLINATLASYLKKDGSVAMTGLLTLFDDPTSDLHAATKQYVDAAISIATPDLTAYLQKVGGVMTGQITLPGGGTGNQAASANDVASGIAAHVALPDPHTQYATDANLTAHKAAGGSEHPAVTGAVNGFMIAADKARLDTVVVATTAELRTGTDNIKYLTSAAVMPILREKLTANKTIYFRTDGNDSNDGSANDSAHAKLTIQGAYDLARRYDLNGFKITLQCGETTSVTFTAGVTLTGSLVGQKADDDLEIIGNSVTPSNFIISTTDAICVTLTDGARAKLTGMELRALRTSATSYGIQVTKASRLIFGTGLRFGLCTNAHMDAEKHSEIYISNNYAITGGAGFHAFANTQARIYFDNVPTITITGTPAITIYYSAVLGGLIASSGVVYSGAVSGTLRYNVTAGGMLYTNGGTASIPGTGGAGTDFHTSPYGWVK